MRPLASPSGASSETQAEQLFSSLALRVTDPIRDAKYDSARIRIASAAVVPSRIWRDTSIWTRVTDSTRELLVHGHFDGGRYAMEAKASVPSPTRPSDARHVIALTRLSDDEFRWDTDVPFAIGNVRAPAFGAMFRAIFAGAEDRSEAAVRDDYRRMLPRASAVAGQMFRVDSIRTSHLPDRSTTALFAVSVTPRELEKSYPALAKYLRRYVHSARMRIALVDSSGASYMDMNLRNGQLIVRVRTAGGYMLALQGQPRLMPDTLSLAADMTVKVSGFTVGVRNYRGEFRIVASDDERAWEIVSQREPEWVLPLFTRRLLRTPLRRPFEDEGALFRIGVRDSSGAQSLLYRTLRLEVQESAILRFIARLGAIAISDYAGDVEREEMAWLRELFGAMLADMRVAPGFSSP